MTRMRGSWFRAVPVPAVWLTLASFRSSTLALTAVVALTPLASAQVADVLPGDQPGPYPHWITAPSDLGWDERLTRSHPELTAADMADTEGELRRCRMADSADVEGILRYRFVGEHRSSRTGFSISFSNDVDCDGFAEVIIGALTVVGGGGVDEQQPGAVYVVSMADVEAADAADGTTDGVIDLGLVAAQPRSWKLTSDGLHYVGTSVASGGEVNGDGCSELLIGARAYGDFTGSAYLVSASDLPAVTPVKAIHFTELRTRIDVLRRAAGLALFLWTDAILTPGVTTVRPAHLLDLREALAAAYAAGGRSAPSWSDAAPTAGSTPIKAVHLMELRAVVVARE